LWTVSPSGLDDLVANPASWYREVALGEREIRATGSGGSTLASVRGRVIHQVLEDDLAGDTEVTLARWRALARAEGIDEARITDGEPELLRHLGVAAADPRVALRLANSGMTEVRFRHRVGQVELVGQIDRLWLDTAAGGFVVLDWKSERFVRDIGDEGPTLPAVQAAAERHTRQLLAYAWAADRVLRAQGQPGIVRLELYFTDIGQLWTWGPVTAADLEPVEAALGVAAEIRTGSLADAMARQVAWPVEPRWAPWGAVPVAYAGSTNSTASTASGASAGVPAPSAAPAPPPPLPGPPPAQPPGPAMVAASGPPAGPSRWGSLKRFLGAPEAAPSPVPVRRTPPPPAPDPLPPIPPPPADLAADVADDFGYNAEPVEPGPPPPWLDAPLPDHEPPPAPDPEPPPIPASRPTSGRRKPKTPVPDSQLSLFGPGPR
jgi:hypothetical protein